MFVRVVGVRCDSFSRPSSALSPQTSPVHRISVYGHDERHGASVAPVSLRAAMRWFLPAGRGTHRVREGPQGRPQGEQAHLDQDAAAV
eukprot:scaffold12038_cov61-Phaeocystis_antarctica.AAC.2